MALYPGLHGEPYREPAEETENERNSVRPLAQKQNDDEKSWRRELAQRITQDRVRRSQRVQGQKDISGKMAKNREAGIEKYSNMGSRQNLEGLGRSKNLEMPEENKKIQQEYPLGSAAKSQAPTQNIPAPQTSTETGAAALAKNLVRKRLRWIILTSLAGFLLANLPIIILLFLFIAAGAAISAGGE